MKTPESITRPLDSHHVSSAVQSGLEQSGFSVTVTVPRERPLLAIPPLLPLPRISIKRGGENRESPRIVIDGSPLTPSWHLSTPATVQGELQGHDVPLHDHLLTRGWFQTGVAASNRVRDYQVRQVRGRRSPGRQDRIREVINSLTDRE